MSRFFIIAFAIGIERCVAIFCGYRLSTVLTSRTKLRQVFRIFTILRIVLVALERKTHFLEVRVEL